MENIKCQSSSIQKIVLPSEADQVTGDYQVYVTVSHEWGDTVVAETLATRDSALHYSYTLTSSDTDSAGVHKIHWRYIIGSVTSTKDVYVNVYQPYITYVEYFANHESLEDEFGDSFDNIERKVRDIIDTFCGQTFNPYLQKTISVDGTNKNTLYLPVRLDSLSSVILKESPQEDNPDPISDLTDMVEIPPQTNFFIRFSGRGMVFGDLSTFSIFGNWGWPWVPSNITEAADILVTEQFNDDSTFRQHGITDVRFDTKSGYTFADTIFDSTGNIDADILLLDYTKFLLEMI